MVGWLIAAGILLLLFIPLWLKVRIMVSYLAGEAKIQVKHMLFTYFRYPIPEAVKKKSPRGLFKGKRAKGEEKVSEPLKTFETPSKAETSQRENADKVEPSEPSETVKEGAEGVAEAVPGSEILGHAIGKEAAETLDTKGDLAEKLKLLKLILKASGKGLKRILRGIRISDLDLLIVCRSDDAAAAAINYGKLSGAVYNGLSFIRIFFTVSVKSLGVRCDFTPGKTDVDVAFSLDFRPLTVLGAGIGILVKFFILNRRSKKEAANSEKEGVGQPL